VTGSIEVHILEILLSLLTAVIGSIISAFIPRLKQVIDTHLTVKQAAVAIHVVDALSTIAEAVVQDFNQRFVGEAKVNGVFSPLVAASVKKDAVAAVMSQSGALRQLGTTSLGDVEGLVGSLIEQAVLKHHIDVKS